MAILFLLAAACCQEGLEALLGHWNSDDPEVRDEASRELVRRWEAWDDEDLALLEGLLSGPESEHSSRARDALERIRIRRRIVGSALESIPGIVDIVLRGSEEERAQAIRRCSEGRDRELIVELGEGAGWEFGLEGLTSLANLVEGPVSRLFFHSLESPDASIRLRGLYHLQQILLKEGRPWVERLLRDPWMPIRLQILALLEQQRPSGCDVDLLPLLEDPEGAVRAAALRLLERWEVRVPRDLILSSLEDPCSEALAGWVRTLGRNGMPEDVPAVASFREHPESIVRREALYALWALLEAESLDWIRPSLDDKSDEVRMVALEAVLRFSSREEAVAVALRMLRDSTEEVSLEAAKALAERNPTLLLETLRSQLDVPNEDVRLSAIRRMAFCGEECLVDLERALQDESPAVRELALRSLSSQDYQGHLEAIVALLQDPVCAIRSIAAALLVNEGDERDMTFFAGALLPLLEESTGGLAALLAGVVERTRASEYVPRLLALLRTESFEVVETLMHVLLQVLQRDQWPLLLAEIRVQEGDQRNQLLKLAECLLSNSGEVSLGRLVGCDDPFVAREAVEVVDARGMARYARLAPFQWHEDDLVRGWAAVTAGEALEEVLWGAP